MATIFQGSWLERSVRRSHASCSGSCGYLLFLALAAGSILYVVMQLIRVAGRQGYPEVGSWCIFGGLVAGFATDYVLVAAGG